MELRESPVLLAREVTRADDANDERPCKTIGEACRERLAAAYAYAAERSGGDVVVLARSQGSKIAADLRAANRNIGGPVPVADENRSLGDGGHTDYGSDPALRGLVETAARAAGPRRVPAT